jgi:nucleoid DNA-binding protein
MPENKAARPASKSAMYQSLAEATGLSRKQIGSVFDELTKLIRRDVGKKGPGVVALPGLLKIKRVVRKARPARQGRNPATGEPMMLKAKPATTVVKAYPLKSLKEMVK